MASPLAISAIVNTHPEAHVHLARALESVLAQTCEDFELVVVCDGPPNPETTAIVDSFDVRFKQRGINGSLLATEKRSGFQAGPKNWATHRSSGNYVAYLDADNEWAPTHLEDLYAAIFAGAAWPDFTYGRRRYVRDPGAPERVGDMVLIEGESPLVPWNDAAIQRLSSSPLANFIDTSDFLVSRRALYWKAWKTGSIWNEKHRRFGDWILMVEGVLLAGWRGRAVDKVLCTYHWTGQNSSVTAPAAVAQAPGACPAVRRTGSQ